LQMEALICYFRVRLHRVAIESEVTRAAYDRAAKARENPAFIFLKQLVRWTHQLTR
jgi:hypothetical protein